MHSQSRLPRRDTAAVTIAEPSSGAGRSGEVGRDDVGGVAVEGSAGAVVAAGLAGVGVSGEVLAVTCSAGLSMTWLARPSPSR